MDTYRETWIPRRGTGTVLWLSGRTLVAGGGDANSIESDRLGSGKVRVTIAGRDSFCRRGEEPIMTVENDGDDIVLYR